MALADAVQQQLGPDEVNQISQQLGISPGLAQTAINAALPMILAGMARHASQPSGSTALNQAIDAHFGAADNPAAVIAARPPDDVVPGGGGLLGRIFGQHHDSVANGVQQASGIEGDQARKLVLMLSPIVLAMLARREFGGGDKTASSGALSGALQQEAQAAAQRSPHVGGLLGSLLNAVESPRP